MKITLLIAALICTYFAMLNVAVKKEAQNKADQLLKAKSISVHSQTAGI